MCCFFFHQLLHKATFCEVKENSSGLGKSLDIFTQDGKLSLLFSSPAKKEQQELFNRQTHRCEKMRDSTQKYIQCITENR